uniref:Tyrosine-protein phosphatase non-receptor type n=1 Tax=Neogobius melanostomus TaxID=47308 RepID=A0A8C6S6Z8_9GOBI
MPLPFGLKLKRTRRYTVSSKSCLVTRIQLLNGDFVEFTLSVESTGQECLEAVAQRLELREITFFSLWFYNKQNQQRWMDLDKPLKKQLDKYGLEPTVYFGVVFYVPSVTQLQQEITRYQYYLQLKKDVLDGKISCSLDQAVHLAGLAVQAALGDFNRYDSQEFLQKVDLFPEDWIQDERVLEEATQKVALGLSAPEAEMLYMQEVEKMEGYGQESFQAKDSTGADVSLGSCLDGIFVKHKNGRPLLLFRWSDINNMTHNRSFFALELSNREESVQFQTVSPRASPQCPHNAPVCLPSGNVPLSKRLLLPLSDEPRLPPLEYGGGGGRLRNGSVYSAHSTSSLTNPQHYIQPSPMSSNPSITGSDYLPTHRHSALIPPSYRATPDYETVMRQKNQAMMLSQEHRQSHSMRNLNIGNSYAYSRPDPLVYSQPEIRVDNHHPYPFHLGSSFHGPSSPYPYPTERRPVVGAVSVPELTNVQLQQAQEYPAPNIMRTQVYRPPPPYPYAHPRPANSTPDLSRHLYVSSSNPDLITRRVHHSVQTFQEDSLPVAHSLQEVSEPLYSGPTHRPQYHIYKRNSIEIAVLAQSLEAMKVKERAMSSSAVETIALGMHHARSHGSQLNVLLEHSQNEEMKEEAQYGHKKSLSDATMLVHSSGEEEEDDSGRHTLLSQELQPPPAYPMDLASESAIPGALVYKSHPPIPEREAWSMPSEGEAGDPSKPKVKKELLKKRPVRIMVWGCLVASGPGQRDIINRNINSQVYQDILHQTRVSSNEYEKHMEQGQVFKEYDEIPKRWTQNECSIARQPENEDRNRFQDVLPYDHNRVELIPTKENNTGYINASHIKITVSGQDWCYIASQGPLQHTCPDFWQMVWEQEVSIIAMVTAEEESGREKSFRYWPKLGTRHTHVTYGRFKITTRFRTESGCYATTGLKIKHLMTGQERTVWHLQYTDWPDHGCPEDFKGFLTYLEEIQSVRRHTNSISDPKSQPPPVLVHCSAGVGRTGVVILSEVMIACLEHNQPMQVPTVLLELRKQRMLMVQTVLQYNFVYKVLVQYLRNARLI